MLNFCRQSLAYGTLNVSLWIVELYDSLSYIGICTFVCFIAAIHIICGYRFYNVTVACVILYSAVHGFWPVVNLAELTEEPARCGEVARGGRLFAWNCR